VHACEAFIGQPVGPSAAAVARPADQDDDICLGQPLLAQTALHLGHEVLQGFEPVDAALRVPVGHQFLVLDKGHQCVRAGGHAHVHRLGACAHVDEQHPRRATLGLDEGRDFPSFEVEPRAGALGVGQGRPIHRGVCGGAHRQADAQLQTARQQSTACAVGGEGHGGALHGGACPVQGLATTVNVRKVRISE